MRTCCQRVASNSVTRPRFAEKVYFILLFAHFVLVHVIKRISNEFSFHTMYYETRCVYYIPSPEARGYKTHNSFHNTSYGMKIHLRSYIYEIVAAIVIPPGSNPGFLAPLAKILTTTRTLILSLINILKSNV